MVPDTCFHRWLCELTGEALEGELTDEQVGRLMVATYLTEGDGSGAVTVALLVPSLGIFALAGGLGLDSKRFARRFAGYLVGCCACHFDVD